MPEPFIGEIRPFAFGFAPKGWAICQGQLLPIPQNQALFALFGTRYGGDGRTTFALPDLRGRTPVGAAAPGAIGQTAGSETVTLSVNQLPGHSHALSASSAPAGLNTPSAAAALASNPFYAAPTTPTQALNPSALGAEPAVPHPNVQPTLVINYCVALTGIFPTRS